MVQSNKQLVHMLQAQGVLKTPRIIEALLHVDRADFCPITMTAYGYHQYHQNPYSDTPSSIGCNATISAPHMHAHALELLEPLLRPGKKVLDIGSGSGYLTVAMGYLVGQTGKVIGMEHIQDLVDASIQNTQKSHRDLLSSGTIEFICGDGRFGYPRYAPYDCIHVGAAAESFPQELMDQLALGGRMIVPVGTGYQSYYQIDRQADGRFEKRALFGVRYVPLTDAAVQLSDD